MLGGTEDIMFPTVQKLGVTCPPHKLGPCLVHSIAEYYAPVWCRSTHTRLIDPAINYALRIVTGCLRNAPADNLPTC